MLLRRIELTIIGCKLTRNIFTQVKIDFTTYTSKPVKDKSGVHRFIIDKRKSPYLKKIVPLRMTKGPLSSTVCAFYHDFIHE